VKTDLVLTITCPDRPAIVERIADTIVRFAANWEESRMVRLGGDFAGIVKISVPQEKADALAEALKAAADEEMTVTVKFTSPAVATLSGDYRLGQLRVAGADHDGILHAVCRQLAGRGVNIGALETDVVLAPVSGTPLFQMKAQIEVPPQISLAELKANLSRIGDEFGVDIQVCPGQTRVMSQTASDPADRVYPGRWNDN